MKRVVITYGIIAGLITGGLMLAAMPLYDIRFGITLMEIFPIGLAVSLISAGLLRKKDFLPDSPKA